MEEFDLGQGEDLYIFDSGVVTCGLGPGSKVLSCLPTKSVVVGESEKSWKLFGRRKQSGREEIALNLTIHGAEWMEGEDDPPYRFFSQLGKLDPDADEKLMHTLSASHYFLFGAHMQLRNLLRTYAELTTIVGPTIPFDQSKGHIVFHVRSPECYVYFDGCLTSLRAFADSIRFTVWNVLGHRGGIPRNLSGLIRSDIPNNLKRCLLEYFEGAFSEVVKYRDNALHYAPLAVRDNTRLLYSMNIICAEIWIPFNPEVRSHNKFEYKDQRDVFRFAKHLLERTLEFADTFYTELGKHRDK